jgi:hypothetical protein
LFPFLPPVEELKELLRGEVHLFQLLDFLA